MKYTNCTIYDCEFDNYVDGVILGNKVFALGYLNNLIPAKTRICEYVDYGMVQFYVGQYEDCLNTGNAKWGYFHLSDGAIVVPAMYDKASPFDGKRARVMWKNKYGFLDLLGNIVIDLIWDDCYGSFRKGLCLVKKAFLWGYIDEEGSIIIKPRFELAEQFEEIKDDIYLARVKKDGKYGYIDEQGNFVISPRFEMAENFTLIKKELPIALVKKDGKYGYIDNMDNYIFEPSFEDAKAFWGKAFAPVMVRGVWGFINIHGEFVVPFQFEQVGNTFFNDQFYTVRKDNQWGIMDENLNILMPEKDARYVIYEDRWPA